MKPLFAGLWGGFTVRFSLFLLHFSSSNTHFAFYSFANHHCCRWFISLGDGCVCMYIPQFYYPPYIVWTLLNCELGVYVVIRQAPQVSVLKLRYMFSLGLAMAGNLLAVRGWLVRVRDWSCGRYIWEEWVTLWFLLIKWDCGLAFQSTINT